MGNLKKNLSYQIAYRILTVITPLITSPIVSRALGAEKLGVFSATQAFASYFYIIARLGIEKYGQRTIATAKDNSERNVLFWEIYKIQFWAALIAIIMYYVTVISMGGERLLVMLCQGLWIVACLFDIGWFFFGIEEFKTTVTRNSIVKIITVICTIVFVKSPSDLIIYTIIMAGGTTLSHFVLWGALIKHVKYQKVNWNSARKHIKPIIQLFIPVIAISVYHLMDKSMLDILSDEENVGWYYAVDKVVNIPLGMILAIGTVMLSRVSYTLKNETKKDVVYLLDKSAELTIFLTCAISFGIATIAKEFIPFFFGPGYEPCVMLMYLFLPVLLIKSLGDIVRTQYLIAVGKDKIYSLAVIVGAVSNVIFNIIMIPFFGAKGAVFGTLLAEFVVLCVQIGGCIKEIPFIKLFLKHGCYIVFGILMMIVVRWIISNITLSNILLQLGVMVCLGAITYLLMCLIYWMINRNSVFSAFIFRLFSRSKRNCN
ncbi:MAG: oligosaccharide flippase family protein [Lachnospiraceae bacterium]|nr:oligosaccharide flippase family protein [Lachnospiraceae bacterium]